MEEEYPLADAPERSRAEFVGTGRPLRDVVGKTRTHIMDEQVGVQRDLLVAQTWSEIGGSGLQRRRVAGGATDLGEDRPACGNGLRRRVARNSNRRRSRRSEEAHEVGEFDDVAGD